MMLGVAFKVQETMEAALELAEDAVSTLRSRTPLATSEDVDACATALVLEAAQLRSVANALREREAHAKARRREERRGAWCN